jgi:GLPGLI family protein
MFHKASVIISTLYIRARLFRAFVTIVLLASCAKNSFSQVTFHHEGTIKYERKTNGFRLTEGSWLHRMYEKEKFRTDTFTLNFDSTQSLYSYPDYEEEEAGGQFWFAMNIAPDKTNVVHKDLRTDTVIAIRQLFDERISITDSIRQVAWKITGETRDIAGFPCQKAVGILYDSLYVVAFYTDQIVTANGPETFAGLPGMIMGLAVPRLYTSWMAISFEDKHIPITKPIVPRKKKTQHNWNSYHINLSERFEEWGEPYKTLFVWMWGI